MKIQINNNTALQLFSECQAKAFWDSIQNGSNSDAFDLRLKNRYQSLDQVQSRLKDAVKNKFEKDKTPDFFIYYKEQLAGVFEFHPLVDGDFIEIGYWLFAQYRRKKIISSVMPTMIKYAKDHFPKSRLVAFTEKSNKPSISLLESLNFKRSEIEINEEYEFEYSL